jgi:hypothetical protein
MHGSVRGVLSNRHPYRDRLFGEVRRDAPFIFCAFLKKRNIFKFQHYDPKALKSMLDEESTYVAKERSGVPVKNKNYQR